MRARVSAFAAVPGVSAGGGSFRAPRGPTAAHTRDAGEGRARVATRTATLPAGSDFSRVRCRVVTNSNNAKGLKSTGAARARYVWIMKSYATMPIRRPLRRAPRRASARARWSDAADAVWGQRAFPTGRRRPAVRKIWSRKRPETGYRARFYAGAHKTAKVAGYRAPSERTDGMGIYLRIYRYRAIICG